MRRRGLLVGLIALTLIASSACASVDGPLGGVRVELSLALGAGEEDVIEHLLDEFEESTGARVTTTTVTGESLWDQLRREVATGEHSIHMFAEDNVAMWRLIESGVAEDLSDVDIPDTMPDALVPEEIDGARYFLPFRPSVRLTYANRDELEAAGTAPPKSLDELFGAAQKLRETSGAPKLVLPLEEGQTRSMMVAEWIVGHGGDPLVLNDEGTVAAFEALARLWQEGLLSPESLVARPDTPVRALIEDVAWLTQSWPFATGVLYEEEDDLDEERLLPDFDVYEGWSYPAGPVHVLGGDVLGITRGLDPEQREAAVELARFLMSAESQDYLLRHSLWVPESDPWWRGASYDPDAPWPGEMDDSLEAARRALESGWYRPAVVHWPDVREAINEAFRRIVLEEEAPREVLDEMNDWITRAEEEGGLEYQDFLEERR